MNEEIKQKLNIIAQRARSNLSTVYNSYELAETCIRNNIAGDFVECGVFCGSQSAAMALANQINNGKRKVHLFDSFVGLPEAGPRDDTSITNLVGVGKSRLISTGVDVCPLVAVREYMQVWGINSSQLIYHEGWFQNTIPKLVEEKKIEKIAILRLDGDLYESTKVCLEYLHPLVEKGGFVIVDDYSLTGCRHAVQDYWDKMKMKVRIVRVPEGNGPIYYVV